MVRISADAKGKYAVSRRLRKTHESPVVDITARAIEDVFDGVEQVRVVIKAGLLLITAHLQYAKSSKREARLSARVAALRPLNVCSLFHGGGVLDKALHAGFAKAGLSTVTRIAVELEAAYLDASLRNNPEIWDPDSIVIEGAIESVCLDRQVPVVDLLVAGIPCTGASRAGRTKNKLKHAESHDSAGALFYSALSFIQRLNPAVVILENVPEYENTASMEVIRSVMTNLGYRTEERVMDGSEFGSLEKRKRLCVLGLSKRIASSFSLNEVRGTPLVARIETILEKVPYCSGRWRSFDYLDKKEKRDIQAGKGFRRQLLDGSEYCCGVIGRHYAKCRSTEPFMQHPDKNLSRLLTPVEHARVKGIPEVVIKDLSDTTAHQILGQSVIFPIFESLGHQLGLGLRQIFKSSGPCQI